MQIVSCCMFPPLIGITAGNDPKLSGCYVLRWDYIRCIERAGGVPIVLAPSGHALHSSLVDRLDGLVLTGGLDIEPGAYGETPHPTVTKTSKERDEFEFLLVEGALLRDLPVLAICRGQQVLNVVRGGTLLQDIPTQTPSPLSHDDPERPRHAMAHPVSIVPCTTLHRVLCSDQVDVNSFHHQAVDRLGDGLIITARSGDGIVEGIEVAGAPFAVGVQWHPEAFWNHGGAFAPLFDALIDAARRHRGAVWAPTGVASVSSRRD